MINKKEWLESLVENYRLPKEEESTKPKRMLTEEQIKIIRNESR